MSRTSDEENNLKWLNRYFDKYIGENMMTEEYTAYEASDGETWYKADGEGTFVLNINDEWVYLTITDLKQMQSIIEQRL